MSIEITDSNFEEIVIKSNKPVLVDFWAEWCAPCRMMLPILEELSSENGQKAIIGKVNVDVNPNLGVKYGIRSLPSIFLFKNGQVVEKFVGAQPKQALQNSINSHL